MVSTNDQRQTYAIRKIIANIPALGYAKQHGKATCPLEVLTESPKRRFSKEGQYVSPTRPRIHVTIPKELTGRNDPFFDL